MVTLNKQVWINQIMSGFYPEASFLNKVVDLSKFVENDKINLANAGFDPKVLMNNLTYPIQTTQRTDTPISIELDLFETENTLVRRPETIEYAYDKLESVIMSHRSSLRSKIGQKAAHAYAPTSDTADTPVLVTTGDDNGEGFKRLVPENILKLKRRFDEMDYPTDKRFLVLDHRHVEDLMLYDLKLFKDIVDLTNGEPKKFAGFNIFQFTKNPTYSATTGTKKAFGTTIDADDTFSSFAFYSDEVMKSEGTMHMYEKRDDPGERATVIGFDLRFVALPFRNKGIGAILAGKI